MKFTKKHVLIILLMVPLFLCMSEEDHGGNPMEFLGKVVNFVILFGGLSFLLYKPLKRFLDNRSQEIEKNISETRESRVQAETRLQESKNRLQELSQEVEEIKKDAKSLGEKEKTQILDKARQESERLKQLASQEIEMLSQAGGRELREYAAELAINRARENLKKKITPDDHSRLIDKSIERLENLYEKPSID